MRGLAIVPAYNEEESIEAVIQELRAAEPGARRDRGRRRLGRPDRATWPPRRGAGVVSLPYNVGIGGAVQTGYQYAVEHGFDLAVQVDGDGQHDPLEIGHLIEPLLDDRADMVVGSRFAPGGGYRGTPAQARRHPPVRPVVSLIVAPRVTDTTSGFRAVNRKAIELFAADYPQDYPEVEATVLLVRRGLRMMEVPVKMRVRETGSSSITTLRVGLLHDQGSARPFHRPVPPLPDTLEES